MELGEEVHLAALPAEILYFIRAVSRPATVETKLDPIKPRTEYTVAPTSRRTKITISEPCKGDTFPPIQNARTADSAFLQSSPLRAMRQHDNPRRKIKSWEHKNRTKEQLSSATTGSELLEVVATAIGQPRS
jgi:hypothetical protein